MTQISRRNFLKYTTGLAYTSLLSSCTPKYTTNLESALKANSFSNQNFRTKRSEVKLPTGNYVFGKIHPYDIIKDENSNIIPLEQLFPYWALKTGEMNEHIFPETKESLFGRDDGKVRLFRLNKKIHYLRTNRGFKRQELPEDAKIGAIETLGPSEFYIPTINFKSKNKEKTLTSIPYSGVVHEGAKKLILITNPSYKLNKKTGFIEYHGNAYLETIGEIESAKPGFNHEIFEQAEIIYKDASLILK